MSSSKSRPLEHHEGPKGEIMRMGYLKKLKTMKKKFFILRGESSEASARLEYYDSEKKWKNSQPPKRTISLKTCFNINRRKDTKQKYVIALYTKDDCFCIVLESEEELQEWLDVLLKLQAGEDCIDGEPPKPIFEHVWKVNLQEKGLGDSKNLLGPYHVCLTDQTLSLVRITDDDTKPETLEFPLNHIRSCGVTGSFFYIEVGRHTVTGAGALWMLTEDANIAKNMNTVICSAFRQCQQDQRDNPHRKRSSSATESSKPTTILQRRQTHAGAKSFVTPGYSEDGVGAAHHGPSFGSFLPPGEADVTPTITTISEHSTQAVPADSSLALPAHSAFQCVPRPPSQRRHSVSAMSSSSVLGTGSVMQHQHVNALTSTSEPSDTLNGPSKTLTVVHQRTKSCPISESSSIPAPVPDAATPLEPRRNSNPLCPLHRDGSQNSAEFAHAHGGDGSGDYKRTARRVSASLKSMTGTRERSDSMPSRNRTSSECGHHVGMLAYSSRIPHYVTRPQSMHSRGLSYSPPTASGPCSTDSAGSSVSIDDGEMDNTLPATSPRYGHSSTPDEAIIEENCDDYSHWSNEEDMKKIIGYFPSERSAPSFSLPNHSAGIQRKVSAPASLKSSSPHQSYMEMCSPYGSSPLETGNYLPMSPGEVVRRPPGSGSFHSRGSSFAEETGDGYVPMAPFPSDDGYVDMEPLPGHRLYSDDHHSDMSPGSSCSFTSGTPSADMRFADYHLDKVTSYLTPSEEDEISSNDRPSRTYSFGSQSETKKAKGKMEVLNNSEDFRVRAFSVGSKWGTPRNLTKEAHKLPSRTHVPTHSTKSSSAPLLSSSWSGTTRQQQAINDPMADLMEMDFRENKKKKRSSSRFRAPPVKETSSQLNLDLKTTVHTVGTSSSDSGYVDMSSKSPSGGAYKSQNYDNFSVSPPSVVSSSPRTQGLNAAFGKSPPKAFAFGRSPPKSPLIGPDGVTNKSLNVSSPPEMSSRFEPKNTRLIKSAIIPTTTLKTIGEKPDVKPQKFPTTSSANLSMFALPNKMQAPKCATDAYVDMRLGCAEPKEDQSYMEMSGRNSKKFTRANSDKDFSARDAELSKPITRKTSVDNSNLRCGGNDDYLLMTGGSQPIAIRNAPSGVQSITSPDSLHLGGSSPFSSIRRNSRRKNRRKSERRGSKDSMTLPSPLSPTQNIVEGNEGTTPTNSPRDSTEAANPMDDGSYMEMNYNEEESPYAEMTPGVEIEDQRYSVILAGSSLKDVENSVRDRTDPHDYVNFSTKSNADADYTVMSPIRGGPKTFNEKDSAGERRKLLYITSANTSTSVPYSATANVTEPKSDSAQKCESTDSHSSSQASSPYPERTSCSTAKDNDGCLGDEKTAESLSRLSLDNSKTSLKAGQRSPISRQVSSSSTSSAEYGDRRTAAGNAAGLDHTSVSRQVSTSSSSSTEVMSVKEGSSPMPANALRSPSRPSSVNSEADITYATLVHADASADECLRSPLNAVPESSGSSPSPNPSTVPSEAFTYAEIDFDKSSSNLRNASFGKKTQNCPQN